MKKAAFIITIILMFCFNNVNAEEIKITDIENHWAKENIMRMIINGKVNGYPDNTFKPDNDVSILEFIKIMLDTLDIKIIEEGLNRWPDYYINTAKNYDIEYDYYKKATRYEAVEIISKLVDLKNVSESRNLFNDIEKRYKTNTNKLVKLKIINGYEDGSFRGENYMSRAESVTIAIRALEAKQKINRNKKYELKSKYTNIDSENDGIMYKILNDKIYFYDSGRFSVLQNYTIDEKNVTNKKLISIIKELASEDGYTAVYYVPSKYIINQIIIKYGKNADDVSKNLDYFSIIYFEDKNYDLRRVTLKDVFSSECYMKISIKKMWDERYKFEKGNYIDDSIKEKLYKSLEIEFGKDTDDIVSFILKVYQQNVVKKENIVEQIAIGKFIVNIYKTDSSNLDFYIEKK